MERIYTIPVNEAFDASMADPACGCPICALYRKLEENELDLILGGSMMEPDVRIRTNQLGFCGTHFDKLFIRKNRLGLGLILESHLNEVKEKLSVRRLSGLFSGRAATVQEEAARVSSSCYICERIEHNLSGMLSTVSVLFEEDMAFRKKVAAQPWFCLPHLERLLESGKRNLPKKLYADYAAAVIAPVDRYLEALSGDVSWFCKKFDYRYGEEPWYNSKDAVERAIAFLSGAER
ncbi:MAG: hypothetical protein J6T24_10260 [Clostridia bacterium]|nr:hypothetical protein [Clostridia bacterium]